MPILERAAPAAGPDATAAAIEVIRAALAVAEPSDDDFADEAEAAAAPPAYADELSPTLPPTAGHGPIRLRGRPVGPARGA